MAFPFPSAYPNLVVANSALDTLLALHLAAVQKAHPEADLSRFSISIAEFPYGASGFRHGGVRPNETHYAASMLKVAAMYAAFELRGACRIVAGASRAKNQAMLFAELKAAFDGVIEPEVAALRIPSLPAATRVPKYGTIFVATRPQDGIWRINFSTSFRNTLRLMIVEGSNVAAAQCITALGYSWINGALANGGFFRDAGKSGIWLAGTFTGSLPYVRIPSVNDGAVAQASTTIDMANLYALLLSGTLVDGGSCREMLSLLEGAQNREPTWLSPRRGGITPRSFTPTHTKIGRGPLKTGIAIFSDAIVVRHSLSIAVVVFANALLNSHDAISDLVDRYLNAFKGRPPP